MQWFKNLNARPRLLLTFGLLLLINIGIGYHAIVRLADANENTQAMYQENLLGAVAIDNIEIARLAIGRQVRDSLLNLDNPQIVAANEKLVLEEPRGLSFQR